MVVKGRPAHGRGRPKTPAAKRRDGPAGPDRADGPARTNEADGQQARRSAGTRSSGQNARAAALDLLSAVLERAALLDEARLDRGLDAPVRARAMTLAETVLRWMPAIDTLLAGFVTRAPPARVQNILRLATAELLVEDIPAHAVVSTAVDLAAGTARLRAYRGLVNAVARRVATEGAALWPEIAAADPVFPPELTDRLTRAWGADACAAMARAHRVRPPVDLSLRDAADADGLARALGAQTLPTGSLRLAQPGQLTSLPGYAEGQWWVQDAAAALPARLLGPVAGARVLDLCAAPGGKTLQLAAAGADVTALDLSGPRLKRLRDNLQRAGLSARIVEADALDWQPEAPFDAIMLDAPCSASGTMRRHPDLMRRPLASLAPLVGLQDRLLDRAFSWLAPGGRLVFATCSLFPQEGEVRIRGFLGRTAGVELLPVPALSGLDPTWCAQGMLRLRPDFWPEIGGLDGFFAAMVHRTP
ncbi:MAG: transcription antitermination factor NusB [Pseudomonadota bacterium]